VASRVSAFGAARVLYVNAFDRFDRTLSPRQTAGSATFDRCQPRRINSFDYVVQHAQALGRNGMAYDTCQNEAIANGQVRLTNYISAIWAAGLESTADETFSAAEQARVADGEPLRLGEVECGDHVVAKHRGKQGEARLDHRPPGGHVVAVVRPPDGKLRAGREAEPRAEPDLHPVLLRPKDGAAAGLVHLDEAREDAIRRASRVVRDEESEHRVESVHRLDYSASRPRWPRNWSSGQMN